MFIDWDITNIKSQPVNFFLHRVLPVEWVTTVCVVENSETNCVVARTVVTFLLPTAEVFE